MRTELKQDGKLSWNREDGFEHFKILLSTLELLDKLLDSEQDFRNIVWSYVQRNSIVTENVTIVILIGKRVFICNITLNSIKPYVNDTQRTSGNFNCSNHSWFLKIKCSLNQLNLFCTQVFMRTLTDLRVDVMHKVGPFILMNNDRKGSKLLN